MQGHRDAGTQGHRDTGTQGRGITAALLLGIAGCAGLLAYGRADAQRSERVQPVKQAAQPTCGVEQQNSAARAGDIDKHLTCNLGDGPDTQLTVVLQDGSQLTVGCAGSIQLELDALGTFAAVSASPRDAASKAVFTCFGPQVTGSGGSAGPADPDPTVFWNLHAVPVDVLTGERLALDTCVLSGANFFHLIVQ